MASGAGAAGPSFTLAFVPGELPLPFYNAMEAGVNYEAHLLGVRIITEASTAFSATAQVPILQSLLAKHPSGLILTPDDENVLIPTVKQYRNAGIPVITTDEQLATPGLKYLVTEVLSNNELGGAMAADYLARLVHDTGEYGVVEIAPGVTTTLERGGGFINEMKAKYPHMKLVALEYNQNSETDATAVATTIIDSHPGLVGLFQAAGGVGVAQAVVNTHKMNKVIAVGYDSSVKETELLESGALRADVLQEPYIEGVIAVTQMVKYLKGNHSIPPVIRTGLKLATTANARLKSTAKYYYYNY
jgi:ribose transport system substrate-binding protein